jgi:ribosomal protein L11 methyltransferase
VHEARPPYSTVVRLFADEVTAGRVADQMAELLDPAETAVSRFEAPAGWAVEICFAVPPDRALVRDLIARAAGGQPLRGLTFETLPERDWQRASLANLHPVAAGRFVVHGRHDRDRIPCNRISIEIEAALAFGTGHHGTTRGCLLALDAVLKRYRPRKVLDVGTGAGVLALAAAKAIRGSVLASDIEARAIAAARANARVNAAGPLITFVRADGVRGEAFRRKRARFDLVLANLVLGPLQRLARPLRLALAHDARVIVSGLLPSQASAALAAYRTQGLRLERRIELDGWVTLTLAR